MLLDIVMPIKEGRYLPHEVLQALLEQEIPFRLFVSTKVSDGDYPAARNNIKQYGKSNFVLMLDNDVVLPPNGLSQMVEFLETHAEYGAIGIPKIEFEHRTDEDMRHSEHVDMSCVVFRREVLEALTFRFPQFQGVQSGGSCECAQACRDIRAIGLEIGFLPHLQAQHLYATEGRS